MAARKSKEIVDDAAARPVTGVALSPGSAFQGVLGQDAAVRVLDAALCNGRLSHAYLFVGPEGVGRELVARRVAAALLCTGRKPGEGAGQVCGQCGACARVDKGLHPDVHLCLTEADTVRRGLVTWNEDRKPSQDIKVEQVRGLREDMRKTAFEGGWRVAIIPDAARLQVGAANALLKTLEEPLPNSLLVLCSPDRGAVLETLRSRCQRIQFPPLRLEVLEGLVGVRRSLEKDVAHAIALDAEGSMGRAMTLAPDATAAMVEQARTWLGELERSPPSALVDKAESLEKLDRAELDAQLRTLSRLAARQAETRLEKAARNGVAKLEAKALADVAAAAVVLRADLQRPGANVRLGLERAMLRMRETLTGSHRTQ